MADKYPTILQVFLFFPCIVNNGYFLDAISWSLSSNPAIFGENVEIQCNLPNNTDINKTRQWSKDVDSVVINDTIADVIVNNDTIADVIVKNDTIVDVIVLNDTIVDVIVVNDTIVDVIVINYTIVDVIVINDTIADDEYKEMLDNITRISTLTIQSFDKDGVNIPYTCQYGLHEYKDVLNMNIESFEKHKVDKDINTTDKDFSFIIKFKDMSSLPECTAFYENTTLTDKLQMTSERVNMFFDVNITLVFHHMSEKCHSGAIKIECTIGSKRIIQSLETYEGVCMESKRDPEKLEKDQTIGYIGLGVFSVFPAGLLVLFIFIIIDKLITKTETRHKTQYNIVPMELN